MKPKTKKSLIEYGIFIAVAVVLYVTGLHTEVIGFAQRGILATGLMNPDVSEESVDADTSNEAPIKVNYNLKLIDDKGNITSLGNFREKVIFLNLWATWCPPCLAEMPNIAKLHEEVKDEVVFVMLSLDQDFNKAIDFNNRKGFNLPIYTPGSALPQQFQSSSTIPTTYVIDANGNLVLTHKGMANYSTEEFKEFLLKQK
ncbi:TlpA family protein disulfide reductase [Aegicerativicinus sediminis]